MFEKLPLHIKKTLAWSVHLFTATGAVWGFLSLLAIFERNWRAAILWIIIAMFVDGFDGMLARWFSRRTSCCLMSLQTIWIWPESSGSKIYWCRQPLPAWS